MTQADAKSGHSSEIVLGTYRVEARDMTATEAMNEPSTARIEVDIQDVAAKPADYRSLARVTVPGHTIAAGWVMAAEPVGERLVVELSNSPALSEFQFEEFSLVAVPIPERVWSVARIAGFRPDSLHIQGLQPRPEVIATFMPLLGVQIDGDKTIGSIRFTKDRRLVELAARHLPANEFRERFLGAGVWAAAKIVAPFLFDGELEGVRMIEAAIDRLALGGQYTMATSPRGEPISFQRSEIQSDPVAVRHALVHGEASKRTWLRTLDNPRISVPVGRQRMEVDGSAGGPSLDAAIRAWRRSIRSRDPVAAAGALFEAIEFYVGDLKETRAVRPSKLRQVREAVAGVDLSDVESERVQHVLGLVNQAPLRDKLLAALAAGRVPYSETEIDALWRLRETRNDAMHGALAGEPQPNDLDIGRALVNRMLVFRAAKPGGASDPT